MIKVEFTPHLQRHVGLTSAQASGKTVREVLDRVFAQHPKARDYVLDESGAVRYHMVVFVDGTPLRDPKNQSDPVTAQSQIYVMQALSGG